MAKLQSQPFYPSHCTEAPNCHGAEGGGCLPVHAPGVPHPVIPSIRVGKGGGPFQPPQTLSTHSSDSFGQLGFREFFASICPILNPLIPPVGSLNLSFRVSPRLCFCPSPLLHPCRGTGNPLSWHLSLWPWPMWEHWWFWSSFPDHTVG